VLGPSLPLTTARPPSTFNAGLLTYEISDHEVKEQRVRGSDDAAKRSATGCRAARLVGARVSDRGEAIRPSGYRTVRAAEVAIGELVRAKIADEGRTVARDDGFCAAAGRRAPRTRRR
jgi:hypothetical protein